jgi:hypothetical protein
MKAIYKMGERQAPTSPSVSRRRGACRWFGMVVRHSHVIQSFDPIDSSSCTSGPFHALGRGNRVQATKADAAYKPGTLARDAAHPRPSR